MSPAAIDLDRLLKLRLVVARFGEMDLAKWWNTMGQLGRLGAAALRTFSIHVRGAPRLKRGVPMTPLSQSNAFAGGTPAGFTEHTCVERLP